MGNGTLTHFLGGSLSTVLLRLFVVSFVVGVILAGLGFEPETIYENLLRMLRRLIEFGLGDIKQIARILLTGAMVVLPIWLLLRITSAGRSR